MSNNIIRADGYGCLVALGSNQEWSDINPLDILHLSLIRMRRKGFFLSRLSKFYKTPCFPAGAGPDYVNACVLIRSPFSAQKTLDTLHAIEADIGRERQQRWGMRTLDLDLLSYNNEIQPSLAEFHRWLDLDLASQMQIAPDTLILPHPRIQDRAFVLGPLNDIVPDWSHPVTGRTVAQMFQALPCAMRAELQVL